MTSCVAFDFDGTLVRSNDIKRSCFYEALSGVAGAEAVLDRLFADGFRGDRRAVFEAVVAALSEGSRGSAPTPEALVADYTRLTAERIAVAPEVPGATEALLRLQATGRRLFLVSATPQGPLDELVDRRGLGAFFTLVLGRSADKETNLRRILAEQGADADHLVFVGDGRDDQAAAEAVGCRFVAVLDQPEAPLRAPDSVRDLRDLPRVLGLEDAANVDGAAR